MSELSELLKQINWDISVSNKKYVYFNKDLGNISTITSRLLDTEEDFIEVDTIEVLDILNGKRSFDDYIVSFDVNVKKFVIKDKSAFNKYLKRDSYLYEIPKYSKNNIVFKQEFLGIHIDVWYNELEHFAGQYVWHEYSIYRILEDQPADTVFDLDNVELIVDQVKLYNDSNKYLNFDRTLKHGDLILDCNKIYSVHKDSTIIIKTETVDESVDIQICLEKVYEGIFVDVWYKELSHVAGQHIWYDGAVYKMIVDQNASTNFDINNVDLVLDNVKLFDDSNKSLDFELLINSDDHVLSNNYLYLSKNLNSDKKKQLGKEIDLYIKQNNRNNYWSFTLNERTKAALKTNYVDLNSKIVLSVTSKEDPNWLYRLFEIPLNELVNKTSVIFEYQFNFEFDNEEVSIYTPKYFKEYSYEVIQ